MYRARKSGERYGQNFCILEISSEFGITKQRTWVVCWNPAVGFVTFCIRKRPILPAMESTKQETPIYGILIIHMDLSKATVNIPFPYTCVVVTNTLDRIFFFRNVTRVIFTQMFCVMNSQPSQRMFLCKHDIRFTTGAQSTLSFQSGHQAVSELAIPQTNRLVVAVHIIGLHSHRI